MMTRINNLREWIWMLTWQSSLTMLLIWMKKMSLRHLGSILKILRSKIENRSSKLFEESLEASIKISNFRLMRMIKKDKKEWMRSWIGWKRERKNKDKIYIFTNLKMKTKKKILILNFLTNKRRNSHKYKAITSLSSRNKQWSRNF